MFAETGHGTVSCGVRGKHEFLTEDCILDVIVTGGAGFIGSHLSTALLDRGLSVVCVDNLMSGSRANIEPLLGNPSFRFIQADITEPLLLPGADQIFHLASPASVVDYLAHPIETLRTNSLGTLNTLEHARRSNARFLFTSTSEVYGNPLVHPQPETYWGNVNPVGVRSCYDESKRFGEAATMQYWRTYGLNARIVRIFNTYGPHSRPDDGRIAPNFISQALRGRPITVYGDGSHTRSFCYVSDLVRGLMAAMDCNAAAGEVINLGHADERTVLDFARLVTERIGSSGGVEFEPLPLDDPERRQPDFGKARDLLGWEPEVDLEAGLDRTIDWFRKVLKLEHVA